MNTLPSSVSEFMIGLRHIGIVTEDLAATVKRLQEIFGLADDGILKIPADDAEQADTRFAFFSIGGTPYEVIQPVSEHFRQILGCTNLGTNHVCYSVSDLSSAVAAMQAVGVRLGHVTPDGIVDLPSFRMAYFNPADTAGLLIEFVEDKT